MTTPKRIGTRWSWVPRLAGYDAQLGVRPCTIVEALARPVYVHNKLGRVWATLRVRTDGGDLVYANESSLWPIGSIVRPSPALARSA